MGQEIRHQLMSLHRSMSGDFNNASDYSEREEDILKFFWGVGGIEYIFEPLFNTLKGL